MRMRRGCLGASMVSLRPRYFSCWARVKSSGCVLSSFPTALTLLMSRLSVSRVSTWALGSFQSRSSVAVPLSCCCLKSRARSRSRCVTTTLSGCAWEYCEAACAATGNTRVARHRAADERIRMGFSRLTSRSGRVQPRSRSVLFGLGENPLHGPTRKWMVARPAGVVNLACVGQAFGGAGKSLVHGLDEIHAPDAARVLGSRGMNGLVAGGNGTPIPAHADFGIGGGGEMPVCIERLDESERRFIRQAVQEVHPLLGVPAPGFERGGVQIALEESIASGVNVVERFRGGRERIAGDARVVDPVPHFAPPHGVGIFPDEMGFQMFKHQFGGDAAPGKMGEIALQPGVEAASPEARLECAQKP